MYSFIFFQRKVEYIKKTSEVLREQYNSDIPGTVEELCKLPGVGPKMAYLVMKCAWNQVTGNQASHGFQGSRTEKKALKMTSKYQSFF